MERRENGSLRLATKNENPSKTQQQFKDECNVNNIIAKYKKGVPITHLNNKTGVYADFTEIGSYQEALGKVIEADKAFNDLPSTLRSKFHNSPQELIDYLNDKDKIQESIELGLRVKGKEPETTLKDLDKTMKEHLQETRKQKVKTKKENEE
jgi:phage internal scaffolding protein